MRAARRSAWDRQLDQRADDAPSIRAALAAELDRGLDGDQYVVSTLSAALARVPECGPYDELARAFAETPYSFGRHFAAEALAATEPGFPRTLAIDCLYDCEPVTQGIGLDAVALDVPAGRLGLEWLAGNPFAQRDLRARASARLAGAK